MRGLTNLTKTSKETETETEQATGSCIGIAHVLDAQKA